MKFYRFSLVLSTLGRYQEVELFLKSLIDQDYKNYELIVVDQNDNDKIKKICEKYRDEIEIKYIHCKEKGLSLGRNIGLKYVSGEIVAFPDDDCEYSFNLLSQINKRFNENVVDIITFKSIDKLSRNDSNSKWKKENQKITVKNFSNTAISYTIFIKYKNIIDIKFDEKLGVGATFGSSEESDLLLSLISKGYQGVYFSDLYAFHPIKLEESSRICNYALGTGALMKKHLYKFKIKAFSVILLKPCIGISYSLLTFNFKGVKKYKDILIGRTKGFLQYKI